MFSKLRVLALCASSFALCNVARPQSVLFQLPAQTPGDSFGAAARGAGDVDGDGFADFLIGSPQDATGAGYAQALSGLKGTPLFTWTGAISGEACGSALAGLGDLDGDGKGEVAIGSPVGDGGNGAGSGSVRVCRGSDGSLLYALGGDAPGDHFGFDLARLADVDGDGIADLAVGAVDDDNLGASSGSVRVCSGATGATLYTLDGTGPNQLFGYAIAGIGDWDGDQIGDLAIGAPCAVSLNQPGSVRVCSGASGATLATFSGFAALDAFGIAVADAGDIDYDGLSDLIVGAPQSNSHGRGYMRVFSSVGPLLILDIAGDSNDDHFGCAVSAAGDANHDGRDDLWIGASGDDDNGGECGSVRLISGQSGLAIATAYGAGAGAQLGRSLAGGFDANGDGIPDGIVGGAGAARAFSGATLTLVADVHTLSIGAGASQQIVLQAGAAQAHRAFVVLGSTTGTAPGLTFAGLHLPLEHDRYFEYSRGPVPGSPLQGALGSLDANGHAVVTFDSAILPGSIAWVGTTFYHAYMTEDAAGTPVMTSNAVPVTIVP